MDGRTRNRIWDIIIIEKSSARSCMQLSLPIIIVVLLMGITIALNSIIGLSLFLQQRRIVRTCQWRLVGWTIIMKSTSSWQNIYFEVHGTLRSPRRAIITLIIVQYRYEIPAPQRKKIEALHVCTTWNTTLSRRMILSVLSHFVGPRAKRIRRMEPTCYEMGTKWNRFVPRPRLSVAFFKVWSLKNTIRCWVITRGYGGVIRISNLISAKANSRTFAHTTSTLLTPPFQALTQRRNICTYQLPRVRSPFTTGSTRNRRR